MDFLQFVGAVTVGLCIGYILREFLRALSKAVTSIYYKDKNHDN